MDYIWRILAFGTAILTITYLVGILLQAKFLKISPTHSKYIWRFFQTQVLLVVLAAGAYLIFDQEAAIACFENFVKNPTSLTLTRAASTLWLVMFSVLVAFDLLGMIASLFVSRAWGLTSDVAVSALVKSISAQFGIRAVPVYIQNAKQSPFIFGVLQRSLVLPEGFAKHVDFTTLRSVIAHEMVHVKDSDTRWNILELLLRRIFFFHPLVYLSKSLYMDAQEKSADLQAIQTLGIPRSEFAQSFFSVIDYCHSSNNFALSASSTSSFKALKSRMSFLASHVESKKSSTFVLFGIGLLITGAWSVVEAKTSLAGASVNEDGINMCVQVTHEMALEKLFHLTPAETVRCE